MLAVNVVRSTTAHSAWLCDPSSKTTSASHAPSSAASVMRAGQPG